MKRKVTYFFGIAACILVVAGCGAHRKNPIAKGYHNTSTLYNYYYNAGRMWRQGVRTLDEAFRVPPEGYIPVLYTGDETAMKTAAADFDESNNKCRLSLLKHPNTKWKDDIHFLVGRNFYYKGNYISAIMNYKYILDSVPDSKIAPAVNVWLAKAYYKNGNEVATNKILDEQLKGKSLKPRLQGDLAMLRAQMHLDHEEYDPAIKVLNDNMKNIKGKLNRARVHFLLGQMYRTQKKFARSYDEFRIVSRINTDYQLIFSSKIAIARLYIQNADTNASTDHVYKLLKRMSRDLKNEDYRDQVYYEIAILDIRNKKIPSAVENLKKSIAYNTSNQRQKSLSYYKIGQLYFYDLKDFKNAEAYFDSASQSITKDAPEYREISNISKTLKEYVKHLNTIHYQDSMIVLGKMDSASLARYIDRYIAEEQAREAAKQAAAMEEMNKTMDPNLFGQPGDKGSSSGFYFNDPAAIESGKVEFMRIWGQRKNEDNWRRKNKALTITEEEEAVAGGGNAKQDSIMAKKYGDKYKYYKDIPRTEEEIADRERMIQEAMYGLGQVYQNKLNQPDSAAARYTQLVDRYPKSDYYLKGLYALFKLYEIKNPDKASEYQQRICSKDPAGIYCKLCKNENVESDLQALDADFQGAYNALFTTYQEGDNKTAVDFSNFILNRFPTHEEIPKVYYLRGLAFGKLGNKDSLRTAFNYLKNNFPDHEVTPPAIRTLQLLDGAGTDPSAGSGKPAGTPPPDNDKYQGFTDKRPKGEEIYVIITMEKERMMNSAFQVLVNDFNAANYNTDNLTVSIFLYQKKLHMAYISKFSDEAKALAYIKSASKDPKFSDLSGPQEKMAWISPANFRVAYGQNRLADYFDYYQNVLMKAKDE